MKDHRNFRAVLAFLALFGAVCLPVPHRLAAQTTPAPADPFYLKLLSDGERQYQAGDYGEAVKTFQVACFGLSQDAPLLGKALAYMSLSYFNLKDDVRAKDSLVRLVALVGLSGLSSLAMNEEERLHLVDLASFYKLDQPVSATSAAPSRTDLLGTAAAKPGTKPGAKPAPKPEVPPDKVKAAEARVKASPKDAQAYLDLYEIRREQKDAKGALRVLEDLESRVPTDPTAPYMLGKMSFAAKDLKAAASQLERALTLRKDAPAADASVAEIEAYLILVYNGLGKKQELERTCRDFLGRYSVPDAIRATDLSEKDKSLVESILGQFKTGGEATGTKDVAAAAPPGNPVSLQRDIEKNPKDASPYYGLYDLYRQKNDRAAAKQTLQNLTESNPLEAKAFVLLGRMHYEDKDYGKAEGALDRVLKLPPGAAIDDALRGEAAFFLTLSWAQDKNKDRALETIAAHRALLESYVGSSPALDAAEATLWQSLNGQADASGAVYLLGVRVDTVAEGIEVKVDLSGPATFKTYVVPRDHSLVVEILHVAASRAPEHIGVDAGGVKSIRTVMAGKDTARVSLEGLRQIPSNRIVRTDSGLSVILEKD